MAGARRIFIDGYNVIRTNPSGSHIEQSRGVQAARQWLIELCRKAIIPGEQWCLVFDGQGSSAAVDCAGAVLTVRFAAPQTADALIRDMACDGAAIGAGCLIVSSDNEVRAEGCAHQGSGSFYDCLLRHAARKTAARPDAAAEIIEKLLAYLSECGHIKTGVFIGPELRDALKELLVYFSAEKAKPQKIARDVERVLREGCTLFPQPDTEKITFRNIKNFFEKHTG